MALAPKLELRQQQTLVMTPQLQQALRLLRMNNLELVEFVAAEVERNPLLEMRGPTPDPGRRRTGGASGANGSGVGSGGGSGDAFDGIAAEATLHEHVQGQIGAMRLDALTREAALILADEMDEDGYLRAPLLEVATRHRLRPEAVAAGLAVVQRCEPAGVGARNLRECLALQLRDRDRFDPAMEALVDNLALLAAGRQDELRGRCGVDEADLQEMIEEIRALDPKPGQRFARGPVQSVSPDIYVTRAEDGGWTVEINSETLPRVLMDNAYLAELRGGGKEARAFVSECSASASWLIRSLEQRARTILRVATEIVGRQERFFSRGVRGLRPLTQRMVAEKLELHESTVSRVTAGKFLACDQGCFELRYFFTAAIPATAGGDAFSAVAVQDRIRLLIEAEAGAQPLSDDRIVAILRGDGIDIARRTVAKYREGMGIPSSVTRRRLKSSSIRA